MVEGEVEKEAGSGNTYLEISMNNTLAVHVVDRLEDLLDQVGGVLLCVASLLHYSVEQFSAVNSSSSKFEHKWRQWWSSVVVVGIFVFIFIVVEWG